MNFRKFEASVLCALGRWVVCCLVGDSKQDLFDYLSERDRERLLAYLMLLGYSLDGVSMDFGVVDKLKVEFVGDLMEQYVERNRGFFLALLECGVSKGEICKFLSEVWCRYGVGNRPSVQWLNKQLFGASHGSREKKEIS